MPWRIKRSSHSVIATLDPQSDSGVPAYAGFIRQMRQSDLEEVHDVFASGEPPARLCPDDLLEDMERPKPEELRQSIFREWPLGGIWVAVSDDRIVAAARIVTNPGHAMISQISAIETTEPRLVSRLAWLVLDQCEAAGFKQIAVGRDLSRAQVESVLCPQSWSAREEGNVSTYVRSGGVPDPNRMRAILASGRLRQIPGF